MTGAGQCIEGVRSMPAPVCSFQRQVKGIAMRAPAAARPWATGRPTIAATCPQTALPSVMAPKKTVTNIASPRPRTHSGNATCAETLRLDKTAIHDTPAITLADSADCSEQNTIEVRSTGDLAARNEREQRPIGAGEQEETHGAHQCCAQMRIAPRVTKPHAQRAAEALHGQMAASLLW